MKADMGEHWERKSTGASRQERRHKGVHRLCVAVLIALFASCALAQQLADIPSASVGSRYPSGAIRSVEQADAALGDIEKERAEIDSRFAADEQACHPQFFATSCVEKAKERRRKARMQLRSLEIEAKTYKRRSRVTARDEALAERQRKDASGKEGRDRGQQDVAHETHAPDSTPQQEQKDAAESDVDAKVRGTIFRKRSQEHQAKMTRRQADESASSKKRAENVAAYERKVQQAQQRQREVAERKAEKEQKRRMKDEPAGMR